MSKKPNPKVLARARSKFQNSNVFATYPSWKALQDYADTFNGAEKTVAHLFIMLAFNTSTYLMAEKDLDRDDHATPEG